MKIRTFLSGYCCIVNYLKKCLFSVLGPHALENTFSNFLLEGRSIIWPCNAVCHFLLWPAKTFSFSRQDVPEIGNDITKPVDFEPDTQGTVISAVCHLSVVSFCNCCCLCSHRILSSYRSRLLGTRNLVPSLPTFRLSVSHHLLNL